MENVLHYTKALAALVAAIATSLLTIFGDGDVAKTLTVIIAVAGVLSVYQFPNAEAGPDEWDHLDDEPV